MDDVLAGREVIFEFVPMGMYVRVSALDVASLTEISIQGPRGAPEEMLRRNALRRLAYVMQKRGIV